MTVPAGFMVLHDRIDPPLPPGRYRLNVETAVALPDAQPGDPPTDVPSDVRYFDIDGPRFQLTPGEVAGVFPPRNGHGPFSAAIPHIALGRRTLPWERALDPAGLLSDTRIRLPDDPPEIEGPPPWLALLLFEDAEVGPLLTDVLVHDVLPASIAASLPELAADARCDAIAVDRRLLAQLLPTAEELALLSHVREVNVEDRELSAGDSDGWFAVVMSNRIPRAGMKYRACLVSLEGRTDIVTWQRPPVADPHAVVSVVTPITRHELPLDFASPVIDVSAAIDVAGPAFEVARTDLRYLPPFVAVMPPVKLVVLHAWAFECDGVASFEALARNLDVGLIGEVRGDHPVVTDTGHISIAMRDRVGGAQTVWYRGPLAPFPLTRDDRGPYHAADQCRRISPETGMEDVTYAAAFEVGRLLAASDARLAQDLMRWRRVDFRRSLERSTFDAIGARLGAVAADRTLLFARVAGTLAQPFVLPSIVGSSRVDLQACKLEYSIVSPK